MPDSKFRGAVEVHNTKAVYGWCVDTTALGSSAPVDLQIVWNDRVLRVVRTVFPRGDIAQSTGKPNAGFSFELSDELLQLLPKGSRLSVLTPDGYPLPLYQPEKHVAVGNAEDAGAALLAKLDLGYTIDKWGRFTLQFGKRAELRRQYANAMTNASKAFMNRTGLVPFLHYGSLLGFARHETFLDHDDDVDLSFLLRCNSIEEVVRHFYRIVDALKSAGHETRVDQTGLLQLYPKNPPGPKIDFFASWITDDLRFYTYFGVGGVLPRDICFTPRVLENEPVIVPDCYEEILALTYGAEWRMPDVNFQWIVPAHVKNTMDALVSLGREKFAAARA